MAISSGEYWERVHPANSDQRSPYLRDRDRILYSRAFRRLSGVTQVARADEAPVYHDRLSHSLKVAQVGTALTDILIDRANERGNDLSALDSRLPSQDARLKDELQAIVETACLAHDLGHPPFGHAAEKALDDLVRDTHDLGDRKYGGFEGNAQSFRIVTKVSRQRKNYPGLNLTFGSLNAILKYPWGINDPRTGEKDKWGYYPSEEGIVDQIEDVADDFGKKSLEADIMDYADDVTYAVHDVDDFYRGGLVPLDQLLTGGEERESFINYVCKKEDVTESFVNDFFDDLRERVADKVLETPFKNTEKEIASLNKFTSYLIRRYLTVNDFDPDDLYIDVSGPSPTLEKQDELEKQVNVLKKLTFYYVIENSTLRAQQAGQVNIIERLFKEFNENSKEQDDFYNMIPHPYRERLRDIKSESDRVRTVVDLICSLSERQAVEMYGRITGTSPGSLREGIIR